MPPWPDGADSLTLGLPSLTLASCQVKPLEDYTHL